MKDQLEEIEWTSVCSGVEQAREACLLLHAVSLRQWGATTRLSPGTSSYRYIYCQIGVPGHLLIHFYRPR